MVNKVNKLSEDVFEQVLEAEMALTRIEIKPGNFKVPNTIQKKSDKALLLRVNSIYKRL